MGLRISLINFNFVMIDIFHKVIVLVRNHLNYFKDNIFFPRVRLFAITYDTF